MIDELSPEDAARLEAKMAFAPGIAEGTDVPDLRFQVLHGRVYTLQVWADGSTARGEMTLDELEAHLGREIKQEGWYDHEGTYLADDPRLPSRG